MERFQREVAIDRISFLPHELRSDILSFLPTKLAATTSLLSRRWRHVFSFSSILEFKFSEEDRHVVRFTEFVNRVLAFRGDLLLHTLSLYLIEDVDGANAYNWINYALRNGVSVLELQICSLDGWVGPAQNLLVHNPLLHLKIGSGSECIFDKRHVVNLPNLKSLHLDDVVFQDSDVGFSNLLLGCPALENLIMDDMNDCYEWGNFSLSHNALKTLVFLWTNHNEADRENFPKNVSFNTPSLVFLDYTDYVAHTYPYVNFQSLVEAKILLRMKIGDEGQEGNDCAGFLAGISNVKNLYLYAETLEVITFYCSHIPFFNNLSKLDIKSNPEVGWETLPILLERCPAIETLSFHALFHRATDQCGDMCLCHGPMIVPSCLSRSPVKILKIYDCGEVDQDAERFENQVKHFIATMPNLDQVIIYSHVSSYSDALTQVAKSLEKISGKASPNCNIQVLPINS